MNHHYFHPHTYVIRVSGPHTHVIRVSGRVTNVTITLHNVTISSHDVETVTQSNKQNHCMTPLWYVGVGSLRYYFPP